MKQEKDWELPKLLRVVLILIAILFLLVVSTHFVDPESLRFPVF